MRQRYSTGLCNTADSSGGPQSSVLRITLISLMSLNPSSLTGISNENEFYTDNYFRTTLPDDLDTWVEKAVLTDAQESREG